ncbi:M1 family metallopeptidase [Hephaestia sp. GCM10023244]|uniref:M1 family metallopeptidase n=1 Tax=unclassified Hephaestia TaxID=2631281 RepID=UPI0020777E08|nr:M1 family metallopeptidase [Hephaestia sp. MAHUQ-44]MCM8730345.1 M1 family metallopeptidase [Hephaestia sp. MAHUQ-44]
MFARLAAAASLAALVAAAPPPALEKGQPPITAHTSSSGAALAPEQQAVRFDTADLAFEIFPEREAIAGVATLHFTAKRPVSRLVIDLDRNLPVSAVAIDGKTLAKGAWSNPEGRMTITLGKTVPAGRTVAATITYGGTPHVAVRAPWDGGFVWAKTPDGRPWVATAVQMEGCDLFWPCIDYPTYEPGRIDLHITVPAGLSAPSNGVFKGKQTLPDGRTTWHWSVVQPTLYGIALNVGPYEEISGTYKSRFGNSIPMFYWHLPGEKAQASALFAEFSKTLDFFESVIGPYPFGDQKLGVVETPHKGMEHMTINAYGNEYAKTPFGFDNLFQHEFAHEWFANQLTAANWDDFWLHEGFAAYMQPLYGEWLDGDWSYNVMLAQSRLGIAAQSPVVRGIPQTAEDVYEKDPGRGGDIYTKGAWTLHTLRNLIGDKAFFDAVRLLVYDRTDPKPGNYTQTFRTTPDFIRIVNQVTGKDYRWLFDVYIYDAALPRLVQTRTGDSVTFTWQTPEDKPFPMPLEVRVGDRIETLAMRDGTGTLAVPASVHIVADPRAKILRQSDTVDAFRAWRQAQTDKRKAD